MADNDTKTCPTCKGKGAIMQGNRECPDCKGKKVVPSDFEATSNARRKDRHRSRDFTFGREYRFFSAEGLEVRDGGATADSIIVTGQPIVYNAPYSVRDSYGEFEETMKPGVAADILDSCDCRFLFNHGGLPMAQYAVRYR